MDHKKAEVLRDSHCLEKNDKELMIMFPGAERWQKGSGGSVFCQVPAKEQDIVSSSVLWYTVCTTQHLTTLNGTDITVWKKEELISWEQAVLLQWSLYSVRLS